MTIRRITIAAAFAASIFVTPSATANPYLTGHSATFSEPVSTQHTAEPVERPCFMVRLDWNEGLDGPQPTCTWYRHAH